jgi:Holliday junction resolvasome RuvABC endonuclease subunit
MEATAQVHGVIAWMLWRDKVPTLYVPPSTLKTFALGKGTGTKTEMTLAASRRLGYEGHSDDEADALWLAHLGAHWLGQPAVDLPATHLRALTKLPTREAA